jgi:hypothetical protein
MPNGAGDAALHEFVAYIAVHELGHVFNLWHLTDSSFMQSHPDPAHPGRLDFAPIQAHYLALAADPMTAGFVPPGPVRSEFGTRPHGFPSAEDNPFAGAQVVQNSRFTRLDRILHRKRTSKTSKAHMKALFIVVAVIMSSATLRAQDFLFHFGHHHHHHDYEQDYDPDSGYYHYHSSHWHYHGDGLYHWHPGHWHHHYDEDEGD